MLDGPRARRYPNLLLVLDPSPAVQDAVMPD
jgi:hypothetical protein